MVLIGPMSGVGYLVWICGGGENLRQQRIRIERDSCHQLIELVGRKGWRRLCE
jgi:hypothetical protein